MIAIKNLRMPHGCVGCPLNWPGDSRSYCVAQPEYDSFGRHRIHTINWKEMDEKQERLKIRKEDVYDFQTGWRESTCPLVEVSDGEC